MGDNIFNLPLTSQDVSEQDVSLISQIFKPKNQQHQMMPQHHPQQQMPQHHPQQQMLPHPHMNINTNGVSPIQKVLKKEPSVMDKIKDYAIIVVAFVIISLPVMDKMLNKLTDNNTNYNLLVKTIMFTVCLVLLRNKV